ncbi:MAG TPA: transketolase [Candidatus Paceibacterota bacterium]
MTISEYKRIANAARIRVLEMIYKAQTSHVGSNLSCIDILSVLYMGVAQHLDSELRQERDRVIASKGWVAASVYYFLAEKGIIPKEDLETYCMPGSKYIGLAEPYVRGIEAAGGAMGHGLPMGCGMAFGARRAGEPWHTYVLMSDGEMDSGTTWESALLAAHHKLDNLTVIIDYNKWQAIGRTNEVLNLEPLKDKWQAFGWEVLEIDGHDYGQIENALQHRVKDKPVAVIAHTTKGKGISEMEDKIEWHYRNIPDDVYQRAMEELNRAV